MGGHAGDMFEPQQRFGYRSATCSCALTSSPVSRCSANRTAFFTGSRYAPVLLSRKIDVCHEVAPTVTATRTEPKPRLVSAVMSEMSALMPAGSETKCQPSAPGYRHSGAVNVNVPMPATGRTLRHAADRTGRRPVLTATIHAARHSSGGCPATVLRLMSRADLHRR